MAVLHLLVGLLVIFLSLYYYFTRTFNYWKVRNVVGPKPKAFFGNLMESALRRKNMGIVFKEIYFNYPNEKVVGVYRMTTPCLFIRDLDLIKHIMIKDFDCFEDRGVEFSQKGLGLNLFHADGKTWRVLRSRFTPLFTSGKLKNMLYLLTERGDKLANYVGQLCESRTEQNIYSLVQRYTMATISACAFGLDVETLNDKVEIFRKIDTLIFQTNYAIELDMMYPGILKQINKSLFPTEVNDFFENLVKTVIAQRNGMPTNTKDFMDLILELRQQKVIVENKRKENAEQHILELTDSIIAAQAFVFYAAGYETSATTMSFLLYELAKNTDVQDKLRNEIDEVLNNHKGEVTYEALMDMKYMKKVFDETLRKYPIVEPLQRNAKVDYQLPGTDVTLKKGQTVLMSPIGIHYDPKYYPDPEKFDPERFNPEIAGSRHPCAYFPFGIGPRNCIGERFAKLQSRVCITKLLSRFEVTTSENTVKNIQYSPTRVVLGPNYGIYLNISPRKDLQR
ncbi:cytochrome P450 6B5-like [Epargyreus clarus]|uniref:cytochrome P450 6B5-like n=1 Tax=Epargyreus clarus TaxID=520877 RepID=UPI003C2CFB9D